MTSLRSPNKGSPDRYARGVQLRILRETRASRRAAEAAESKASAVDKMLDRQPLSDKAQSVLLEAQRMSGMADRFRIAWRTGMPELQVLDRNENVISALSFNAGSDEVRIAYAARRQLLDHAAREAQYRDRGYW